jgi:hypothetical protein
MSYLSPQCSRLAHHPVILVVDAKTDVEMAQDGPVGAG